MLLHRKQLPPHLSLIPRYTCDLAVGASRKRNDAKCGGGSWQAASLCSQMNKTFRDSSVDLALLRFVTRLIGLHLVVHWRATRLSWGWRSTPRVALQCTTRSRPPTHSFLCCDTGIPCGGALQIRTFPSAICTPRRVLAPGQTGQASWYKSALCRRLRRDIHCTRHGQPGTGKRPDLEVLAGFLGHLHMCPSLDES